MVNVRTHNGDFVFSYDSSDGYVVKSVKQLPSGELHVIFAPH
jgi:hypothetical protein